MRRVGGRHKTQSNWWGGPAKFGRPERQRHTKSTWQRKPESTWLTLFQRARAAERRRGAAAVAHARMGASGQGTFNPRTHATIGVRARPHIIEHGMVDMIIHACSGFGAARRANRASYSTARDGSRSMQASWKMSAPPSVAWFGGTTLAVSPRRKPRSRAVAIARSDTRACAFASCLLLAARPPAARLLRQLRSDGSELLVLVDALGIARGGAVRRGHDRSRRGDGLGGVAGDG